MELLSLGADVAFPSTDGSNALHYAALNERKAIIEVLLRSGADPSVPNNAGVLPIELVKTPEVRELFLRDRSSIFSPIAQTNNMLSEYMRELTASHMADKAEGSARLSGFDLNRDLAQADAENIPNGNRDAPAVDSKRTTLQKKAFGTINNSASTRYAPVLTDI